MSDVRIASHLSTAPATPQAVEEACSAVLAGLAGEEPTLAVAFASPHHHGQFESLPATLTARLGARHLIGCTGEGVVGTGAEVEEEPALSVWAAHLPRVTIHPFHVRFEQKGDEIALHGWPEPVETRGQVPVVLVIPEPFSSVPSLLIEQFQQHYAGAPLIGGIASGGMRPGKNRLFLGDRALDGGAVGMLLWGPVEVRTLVSQGCRPIGRHLVITKAQHNLIFELGGKPAFAQFQTTYEGLDEHDQELARKALHVGCVINEHQTEFHRGDFLVRNIMGIDPQAGTIAITDHVRVGQTVQFHVRDADTASEDLELLLASERERRAGRPVAGALLFTCNGRGTRMFDAPNHDATKISACLGPVPVAGFFAQGEIGPVGGKNFLHGFTASMALFG